LSRKSFMSLIQKRVSVLYNTKIGPVYYRMGFTLPELARAVRPGQFVMVRPSLDPIPLLRRPFSVHRQIVEQGKIVGVELLYKVVGQGTRLLCGVKGGDVLDVLGPLGNGFSVPDTRPLKVFIVAGGVGIASLYYLSSFLAGCEGITQMAFLGGCAASDILCEKELRSLGIGVYVSTEDCSLGDAGLVTRTLEKGLATHGLPDLIYACGPQAMLKAVGDIALSHRVSCQVSIESAMACGFGVCLGCAVPKAQEAGGYVHVCTDGPVFDFKDIRLDSEPCC
jgi:dihydroorotate dehydrogenase electron transfer subunit